MKPRLLDELRQAVNADPETQWLIDRKLVTTTTAEELLHVLNGDTPSEILHKAILLLMQMPELMPACLQSCLELWFRKSVDDRCMRSVATIIGECIHLLSVEEIGRIHQARPHLHWSLHTNIVLHRTKISPSKLAKLVTLLMPDEHQFNDSWIARCALSSYTIHAPIEQSFIEELMQSSSPCLRLLAIIAGQQPGTFLPAKSIAKRIVTHTDGTAAILEHYRRLHG